MSEAVARWAIERLAKHHDRSAFECGQRSLSDWIRQSAGQFMDRDLSRVYVAVSPGQSQVLGYYAISNAHIRPDDLPRPNSKRLPRHIDVPVALIGKLAVDRGVQGQGLGAFLLIDAPRRIRAWPTRSGSWRPWSMPSTVRRGLFIRSMVLKSYSMTPTTSS